MSHSLPPAKSDAAVNRTIRTTDIRFIVLPPVVRQATRRDVESLVRTANKLRRLPAVAVVLVAIDIARQAVELAVDLHELARRELAAVVLTEVEDLVVEAHFPALETGRLARGELSAGDAGGDAVLLVLLTLADLAGVGNEREGQR